LPDVDRPDLFGFLDRLLGPRSAVDVVGGRRRGEEVHRDHRELQAGAARKKQHAIVRGDGGERTDVGLGLGKNRFERLRAMADLEDRHPHAGQRDEVALHLFQDRHRQHRRSGGEIVDALI
jgi:hypothetical protein